MRREKPVVRPEEIPPVPENRFLLRKDVPAQEENPNMSVPDSHSPRENLRLLLEECSRFVVTPSTVCLICHVSLVFNDCY